MSWHELSRVFQYLERILWNALVLLPFMKTKEGTGKVFRHHRPYTDAIRGREIANGNSSYVAERFPSYSVPKDWTGRCLRGP